jgi:hypothetical protein
VSDVTAEEVRAERGRANAFFVGLGFLTPGPAAVTAFATALAARAREARREALREALGMMMRTAEQHRVDGWDVVADVLYRLGAAIRALLGPET